MANKDKTAKLKDSDGKTVAETAQAEVRVDIPVTRVQFKMRRSGTPFTCPVLGVPTFNEAGEFTGVDYAESCKVREEVIRKALRGLNIDVNYAMLRGGNVILKEEAAGSSTQDKVLLARMAEENIASEIESEEERLKARNRYVRTVLSLKQTKGDKRSIEWCYQFVVHDRIDYVDPEPVATSTEEADGE